MFTKINYNSHTNQKCFYKINKSSQKSCKKSREQNNINAHRIFCLLIDAIKIYEYNI